MMIPIPRRGVFKRVEGEEDARARPARRGRAMTAKPDQLLEPLPEAGSYLGFIFARAANATRCGGRRARGAPPSPFTIDPAIAVVPASAGG